MRKNLTLSVFVLAILLMVKPALAHHIDDFFFVKTIGSFSSTSNFDISETPILYVKASHPGDVFLNTFWTGANNDTTSQQFSTPGNDLDHWLVPQNWASVKEIGLWKVQIGAFFPAPNNEFDSKVGTFTVASGSPTVTPEPISTLLFLTGGAPLAYGLIKRRKQAKV